MQESKNAGDDQHSAWYLFLPAIGYARSWQGEPLPVPPREDAGKARLNGLLKDYAGAFLDEVGKAGALAFNRLWCGGRLVRVFLAPKTASGLKAIAGRKAQLENLEKTVREWAPDRYAEVASEWQRFRPAGHGLVMGARAVCLPGEEAEMQVEANEMFRDAYGDAVPQPRLAAIAEPAEDDPDRWHVIIGWLKLAGLDGIRCAEIDSLNWVPEEGLEAKSPDRRRGQALVRIFTDVAPELSTGAWFDLEDVRQASERERQTGGEWHERFTDVARLGSHLSFFWCNGNKGIKGPYFFPRVKGIVDRLSEGRHSYRQAVARKAKDEGAEVRSLMLLLEVHSPWLGREGSDEPQRLRQWFAAATRGVSLLDELYWETPWTFYSPLAVISPKGGAEVAEGAEAPPGWRVAEGRWTVDAAGRIVGESGGNGYLYRLEEHADDVRLTAKMRVLHGIEVTVWMCGSPEKTEFDGYTLAVSTEKAKLQRQGEDVATDPNVTIKTDHDHVLSFERRGAKLRGFLDGAAEPFIEWADPQPLRGEGHRTLGFYVWDGTVAVSDIEVEELRE